MEVFLYICNHINRRKDEKSDRTTNILNHNNHL